MTMTDAAAAAAQAAAVQAAAQAARISAVAEAREAIRAAERAARLLEDGGGLAVLRGQEAWLGPARAAFDARGAALQGRLRAESHELRMLVLAIEGCI
ncbi:hypothetical protein [Agrococcus sp. KRD186]|jgi:hypothetical protein|uniref:hypothetical protein n=1 Tax=Agrococcus sp. KRD186 TaxID=2729730 RepID=UPI0019D0F444|nr:hypothetical protein [Agrococcus sp. KRD186]